MVFWIFKKKRDEEAHKKIDNVHKILKESFTNVKKDISSLGDWQKNLQSSHEQHKGMIYNFERRLKQIEYQMENLQNQEQKQSKKSEEIKSEFEEATFIDKEILGDILKVLTSTHQKIFLTLYQLQKQLGTNKVSYKSLANVIYNNKSYAEIRSTLSQYISFLEDHGLVEKARKGKESFVGITDPGFDLIEALKDSNPELKLRKKY